MTACPKIPYASRADAMRAARDHPNGAKPYVCPRCGLYHLGTTSKQEARRRKRER